MTEPISLSAVWALCVAAGIGLLIGAERERRKGSGPWRAAAGIRTFTVAALLGAVAQWLGQGPMLVVLAAVALLAVMAYQRSREHDPGLTTEIALVLTCLLGGLAVPQPALAAGVGVALAALLAARDRMHRFVRRVLTERELHDAILFAAAALIVLPLAPDRALGPYAAINPHRLARLVVLVMAVGALGYIAVRMLGARRGLPLAGFAAGFVSSTVTIHAMGRRAREQPAQASGAIAGAALSTVATFVQLAVVIAAVQPALLQPMAVPLVAGGAAAALYATWFLRQPSHGGARHDVAGRAFDLRQALAFGAIIAAVTFLTAALHDTWGDRSVGWSAALGGLVDVHAAAASTAALASGSRLPEGIAVGAIGFGISTNALVKAAAAWHGGGRAYAARIVPGQVLVLGALWLAIGLTS